MQEKTNEKTYLARILIEEGKVEQKRNGTCGSMELPILTCTKSIRIIELCISYIGLLCGRFKKPLSVHGSTGRLLKIPLLLTYMSVPCIQANNARS